MRKLCSVLWISPTLLATVLVHASPAIAAEPYLTEFQGGNPRPFKVDVPLHIEAFYRYQVADRISITPGLIWLTAPDQDNNNGSAVVATIRTTFQF